MKKIDAGELISIIANIGVIAGIVFLALELRQNNELIAAEARATYASMDQTGWSFIIENPDLADLLIKDRNGGELSESEMLRLNALWLQNLAQFQFRFLEDPDHVAWVAGQRRNYESYSSLRSAWEGNSSGSRQAGKDSFDPNFVRFYEENVVVSR
jgi:hypothetical protein